jgi:hypothetical protein
VALEHDGLLFSVLVPTESGEGKNELRSFQVLLFTSGDATVRQTMLKNKLLININ